MAKEKEKIKVPFGVGGFRQERKNQVQGVISIIHKRQPINPDKLMNVASVVEPFNSITATRKILDGLLAAELVTIDKEGNVCLT